MSVIRTVPSMRRASACSALELELVLVQQPAGRLHQEVEQEVARLPWPITVVHVTGSRDEPEPRTGDAPRHPSGRSTVR